jgi:hypothetical protein
VKANMARDVLSADDADDADFLRQCAKPDFFCKLFSCCVDFPVAGIILIGVLKPYAFVAQSVEQLTLNQLVDGSNPPEGTILKASILTGWGFFFDKKQQQRFFEALPAAFSRLPLQ